MDFEDNKYKEIIIRALEDRAKQLRSNLFYNGYEDNTREEMKKEIDHIYKLLGKLEKDYVSILNEIL